MKIVLATPLYPPEPGGPATYAEALVQGLPGMGIEVVLVKFSDVRNLPKMFRHFAYYRRVLREAKHADVVLALDPVSVGFPAALAARHARKAFVVKIVGDYAWEQGAQRFGVHITLDEFVQKNRVPLAVAWLRRVQNFVARSAANIVVPSSYLKNIVSSWDDSLREKISIIYNSIELPEPIFHESREVSELQVLTVGRLVPWKQVDKVIAAVAEVRIRYPEISLTVIGDGPERERLEDAAHRLLHDGAVFVGARSHEETLRAMGSCGMFILNSSYEGLSHVLIEACMVGCAVIATNVGGNPEVITNGENGILVPNGDTAALTAAIEKLLEDPEECARLRAGAKESSIRFVRTAMLSQTAALLASAAGVSL